MNPSVLSVHDLSLRFGGVTALSGVNFDVQRNEVFAIIGPNGAGKTSVFNCVNGLYRPQQGRIILDGVALSGRSPARIASLGVARTFQNLGLFSNLDVLDNLMLGRHLHMRTGFLSGALWWGRARREEIEQRGRVERIVEFLDLAPYRYRPVGTLPYGIQKRIELGRALAMEPKLLLLDEPVAGMAAEEIGEMAGYLRAVRDTTDISLVLVEHDMGLVMRLADRVMVLDFGRPVATGTPAEVQADPRVIDAYLGHLDPELVTTAGRGSSSEAETG